MSFKGISWDLSGIQGVSVTFGDYQERSMALEGLSENLRTIKRVFRGFQGGGDK